ncbi:putative HTH-type transcriptional regulator [Gordonia insulae]|uniref:Putative HTH-type transcriptional regulator n=2 Tax=Gordonia insulae TaxID=2420509 RepID=A0A3G8JL55_9ACTN|nr:putative HTH-type transcriptional regulator [Gordonia insulae]
MTISHIALTDVALADMPRTDTTLSGELALAVVRLARRLRGRRVSKVVSLTQLSAMSTLHHEGPMTPGALALAERVQPPSMTRVIASLSDLGMVRREPHPTDGRQAIVTLAERGSEVITAELDAREEWLSARIEELTPEERATLSAVVPIIKKIITGDDDRGVNSH